MEVEREKGRQKVEEVVFQAEAIVWGKWVLLDRRGHLGESLLVGAGGYMFWGRERQALHTAPETGLHSAFYCKGRKRYEKVTWSDWHFRKSQRKDRTLAQKEMEGGGSNGDAEGETSLGLDLEGGKMLK